MPIVEWSESFCLGIDQFDKEHKHLVELINLFYDACNTEAPVENLGQFFDELMEYAAYHFHAEEAWMKDHEYLKFAEHQEMHAYFIHKIEELQTVFVEESKDVSLETLSFLMRWLRYHILIADADYARSTSGR